MASAVKRRPVARGPRTRLRWSHACVSAMAMMLAACGWPSTPQIDGGADPADPDEPAAAIASPCGEVASLVASAPDDAEPTGTTAEPVEELALDEQESDGTDHASGVDLAPQIEAWAQEHAPDSYAGIWIDNELGGYAVAFAKDVERHTEAIREQVHPGIAVAEAEHTEAELRDIQDRIANEEMGRAGHEPGAIEAVGVALMENRTFIDIVDPDDDRLAELSDTYGASAICFAIAPGPQDPAESVVTLAKDSGWRDGFEDDGAAPFATLEVAYDRETAEVAWDENVDDTTPRDDELPADPGLYGDLDDVDFEEQVLVVWSSGQSGSCPAWLADVDTTDGIVQVEIGQLGNACDADYNPYRLVVAVDRQLLPEPDAIDSSQLDVVADGEIRAYPITP